MDWGQLGAPEWPSEISHRDAKEAVASRVAAEAKDGDVIGVGSGSTSYLAMLALGKRVRAEGLQVRCVPTSLEIESYLVQVGLPVTSLVAARPDWCFDGADEVDPSHNLLKGRGGAFVREKLVFAAARRRFILVDDSKFVTRLGVNFPLPVAVIPEAANLVRSQLVQLLGVSPTVRPAGGKDGGVITEQGTLVMDLEVDGRHEPAELNALLNSVIGIVGTGLFTGFTMEVLA